MNLYNAQKNPSWQRMNGVVKSQKEKQRCKLKTSSGLGFNTKNEDLNGEHN
jgi:hypothetical protein